MSTKYRFKAHPTRYAGVLFRSRLEARWAAFFNCMKWKWQYEPIDLEGWTPDFSIVIDGETIYVEVKPYDCALEFAPHPCMSHEHEYNTAGFGLSPDVTIFKKALRGVNRLNQMFSTETAWIAAGNLTQWKKPKRCGSKHR